MSSRSPHRHASTSLLPQPPDGYHLAPAFYSIRRFKDDRPPVLEIGVEPYGASFPAHRWPVRQSEQVYLLLAWIEACLDVGERGSWAAVIARFESAIMAEEDRQTGRLSPLPSLLRRLNREAPDEILHMFRAGGDAMAVLVGHTSRAGDWTPGIAGLTEREAGAVECYMRHIYDQRTERLRPPTYGEVARMMHSGKRGMPPSWEAVHKLIWKGRSKLRSLVLSQESIETALLAVEQDMRREDAEEGVPEADVWSEDISGESREILR